MNATEQYLRQLAEQLTAARGSGEQWTLTPSHGDYVLTEAGRPGLVVPVLSHRGRAFMVGGEPFSIDLTPAAMAVAVAREVLPRLVRAYELTARATALLLGCIKEAGHAIDDERDPLMLEAEATTGGLYLYVYRSNGDDVDPRPGQLVAKYLLPMEAQPITSDDLDDSE